MHSFAQLMIIYTSILLITVSTLPIDDRSTQKSGLSGNQLIHQVNIILDKYVNAELTKAADNISSTGGLIDKLNSNNDKNSKLTIHVQNFTAVLPATELSFKPSPEVLENKQIKTEFSNSTHNKIKLTEDESEESSESKKVKRENSVEISDENSAEYSGESAEYGCDAAELDALVATYDPSKYTDDAETTTESISDSSTDHRRTTSTKTSIEISDDTTNSAKLTDQPTEAPSNSATKMEEAMKKIAEVSAVPVILTQGV